MRAMLAVIASLVVLAACSTPNAPVPQLLANGEPVMGADGDAYERGKQHLLAGNYGFAAGQLRAALRNNPLSLDILNALAVTYQRLGRHDVSQRYFAQALAIEPRSVQTLNNIARSLLDSGSASVAVTYLRRAQTLDPNNPVVRANLADVNLDQPDSNMGSASVSASGQPANLWIERTSASKQTLVTRGDSQFVGESSEQNALLRLVNFATVTANEKVHLDLQVVATAATPIPPRVPVRERPNVVLANGNGRTGMAARMRDYLQRMDCKIGGVSNADQFNYATTTVIYKAEFRAEAVRIAGLLPVKVILLEKDGAVPDVVLRIGRDLLPFDHAAGVDFKSGGQDHGFYVDL